MASNKQITASQILPKVRLRWTSSLIKAARQSPIPLSSENISLLKKTSPGVGVSALVDLEI